MLDWKERTEFNWIEEEGPEFNYSETYVNDRILLSVDDQDRADSPTHPWRYSLTVRQNIAGWQPINFGHATSKEEAKQKAIELYQNYLSTWITYKREELLVSLDELDKIQGSEQPMQVDADGMSVNLTERGSYWVTANNISLAIILGELGLKVKAYPLGYEMEDELAEMEVWYDEAKDAIKLAISQEQEGK